MKKKQWAAFGIAVVGLIGIAFHITLGGYLIAIGLVGIIIAE